MRILLIEDDANKADQIVRFISSEFQQAELTVKRSFQSGLRAARLEPPDFILLDMTMPNYDVNEREPGGEERRYAGREILRQIERHAIPVPVAVVTQYEQFEEEGRNVTLDELRSSLRTQFPNCFRGAVFYQAANTEWKNQLRTLIANAHID